MIDKIVYKKANRQYVSIPKRDLWRFVNSQKKMVVGFVMRNGFPHVSPVWFCTIKGKVYFVSQSYKVKVNLSKSGKACCMWEDGDRYRELRGAIMWGKTAKVSNARTVGQVNAIIARKYRKLHWDKGMPSDWIKEREKEKMVVIEITPKKASSWDNNAV